MVARFILFSLLSLTISASPVPEYELPSGSYSSGKNNYESSCRSKPTVKDCTRRPDTTDHLALLLQGAVSANNIAQVQALLDQGADPYKEPICNNCTILTYSNEAAPSSASLRVYKYYDCNHHSQKSALELAQGNPEIVALMRKEVLQKNEKIK